MSVWRQALTGGFRAECLSLGRSPLFVVLTTLQAVTFLFLVSLFGLTGSRAPTALVSEDDGKYAALFVAKLAAAHHSFALRPMDQRSAAAALKRGDLAAVITIPKDFSDSIARGADATVRVSVDNVNTDMTEDIQRALPSAIVAFGGQVAFPGIRVHVVENDLIRHDTGFIPYLVVSGLVLDVFLIAGLLSAMTVAREFESGTIKLLALSPVPPLVPLAGRVLAASFVAGAATAVPLTVVILGYGVTPLHPAEMCIALILMLIVFSCIGAAWGALLKRTLPVTSLIVGLSLPLYICSGSLEPQRFDGVRIWALAHFSPAYYGVGLLEHAFHGFQVTPESVPSNFAALLAWAVGSLMLAAMLLRRRSA